MVQQDYSIKQDESEISTSNLTENAESILRLRYLQNGETPEDMFRRVASVIAQGEKNFGSEDDVKEYE